MELTARDFERIPRGNLHVPVHEFARLWLTAERRGDARAAQDWYLAGVQVTCRWLAGAFVTLKSPPGPRYERAVAPITGIREKAYEELVELETQAAERAVHRRVPGRPGFVEGALSTLAWAWRRSGVPPIDVEHAQAG